jgi:mannose-1-phosphate guanylyltransferase/mannose-6-phosphate isomerase
MTERYAVILCGGSGTRLWPLSRSLRPKQFLNLNGDLTLLQQTAQRLLKWVVPENLLTVTHVDQKFEAKGQLSEISPLLMDGVLAEPQARNTLPAIAWAASVIYRRNPDAIVGVFPSDHAIGNEPAFLQAWQAAEMGAEEGYLALIGISPAGPATGYGYIQPGERLPMNGGGALRQVARFVEKPDQTNAMRFLKEGYLWNGGMFIFRAAVFMQLLEKYQPEIHRVVLSMQSDSLAESYARMPCLSIDYGLAEKADGVAVVAADMDWSDLGNWDSIYDHHAKDACGNVEQGDVIAMQTSNSLLWTTHGLLATLGVGNLAVIQTADATLICNRNRTEDIKALQALIQERYPHLLETHLTVHRPWGIYTVLEEKPKFKIKRIVVNPGAKLSMQLHNHRSEHWVVVAGTARITNGEKEIVLRENESTFIPIGHRHRLENPSEVALHIIEVQCGDYVGEDDIVRFEDTYGRGQAEK